jgi:hypothetical protein
MAYALSQGTLAPADYVIDVTVDQTTATAYRPNSSPSPVAPSSSGTHELLYVSWIDAQWKADEIG